MSDAAGSRCEYLKEACQKSLLNNVTEFCWEAAETCCAGNDDPWCGCNVYQQICADDPAGFACDFAAESCCDSSFVGADDYALGSTVNAVVCRCQFLTYLETELGYKQVEGNQ